MKMNLVIRALDFKGEPIRERGEELWLNKVLANVIATQDAKDDTVMQKYELAHKLFNAQGEMEITGSEVEIIKSACKSGRIIIIIAAQILQVVNNAKE